MQHVPYVFRRNYHARSKHPGESVGTTCCCIGRDFRCVGGQLPTRVRHRNGNINETENYSMQNTRALTSHIYPHNSCTELYSAGSLAGRALTKLQPHVRLLYQ